MDVRVCARCGTPARAGGSVCERCELPLDPTPRGKVRYNPAGLAMPSPVQGHATVMVGIIAAAVLLLFGAWFALRGVGPFHAEVVRTSELPAGAGVVVDLRVVNDGARAGQARCRLTGVAPSGLLNSSGVELSPVVPPHGSVPLQLRLDGVHSNGDLETTCS